jgi:lipopolysaccharide export system protein LptA
MPPIMTLDPKCKRAAPSTAARSRWLPLVIGGAAVLASVHPVLAERADRTKDMVIEGDKSGTWDLQRQVMVWIGNVTISQGTMLIRADRVELRELPNGFRAATAIGSPGRPASYRQKRDNLDEFVEGQADRIEFDGRADTVRFVGNGLMRQLRGAVVANEVTGQQLVWANTSEQFTVEGGAKSAANPTGRVRAVLSPPPEAASAPAVTPPGAPAASGPGASLRPSRTLSDPR